jgi:hypothetical protein
MLFHVELPFHCRGNSCNLWKDISCYIQEQDRIIYNVEDFSLRNSYSCFQVLKFMLRV